MSSQSWFKDRLCVIATMHKKEQVIAPILEQKLSVKTILPLNFNTDFFGTFTREIPRLGNQLEAARTKAKKALELTGETLAIASEGSFNPDPYLPFSAINRELVLLIDNQRKLEITGQHFSPDTNFAHEQVKSLEEALNFAQKVGFPKHALVIITKEKQIIKGITDPGQLQEIVTSALKNNETVHLETDMRAMYNPTRMKAIALATHDLITKINSICPQCATPGFTVIKRQPGLPCALCRAPTSLIIVDIYRCQKCGFTQEQIYPNQQSLADPTYCNYCNP